MRKLDHDFYVRDTATVAQELLGKLVVHRVEGVERVGRIVETEAYLGAHDLAAHSAKGVTKRTQVMYGPPGRAYVYLIYGMHHCMNVVTEPEGNGSAVLIRALEPMANVPGNTKGPGLLCKAMSITRVLDAHDLMSEDFYIAESASEDRIGIVKRPRIGVDYAGDWAHELLRFYIEGNAYISRK